jgi:predicted nucleotidyltransferase
MKTFEDIKKKLESHKTEMAKRYKVKEIGIFGSFARGENRRRSDVDILVDFEEMPGFAGLCDLESYIEKLLRRKVDVVRKAALRPELREIILKEVVYL